MPQEKRPKATWHVEVYRGKKLFRQAWRFRVQYDGNNRFLSSSNDAYTNMDDCVAAAHDLADPAGAEVIVDLP